MAKFRNVSGEARLVGYGCPQRTIEPDDVLGVLSAAAISYAGQPDIWEPVDDEAHDAQGEYDDALRYFAGPSETPPAKPRRTAPPTDAPATDADTKETVQ